MTATETRTDVAGRKSTTYTDGRPYYLGQHFATVIEGPGYFTTICGWYERNGWNGSIESVCSSARSDDRPVKTRVGAERRAALWIAKQR